MKRKRVPPAGLEKGAITICDVTFDLWRGKKTARLTAEDGTTIVLSPGPNLVAFADHRAIWKWDPKAQRLEIGPSLKVESQVINP